MPIFHRTAHVGQGAADVGPPRLLVATMAAVGSLWLSVPAHAETAQYYSASVGGLRVGMGEERFGASSKESAPVAQSLNGSDWAASAGTSDADGGTATVSTLIASPATASPTYVDSLQAEALITYDFTLEGPAVAARIPVLLTASGAISARLDVGYARALLQFGDYVDSVNAIYSIDSVALNTMPDDTDHLLFVNDVFWLTPGNQLSVSMDAFSRVSSPGIANGKVARSSAWVDPVFTILGDYGGDYQFVGLPASAIGQLSPVPDPSTGMMMAAGLGLLGSWIRRRRIMAAEATSTPVDRKSLARMPF